jgi:four helix bundle protein
MALFTYRDVEVWRCSMVLVERCCQVTALFPKGEVYGLTGRLRRAAVSIATNLVKGHCRRSTRAYVFQVSVAFGSHAELESCVELARRLRLLPDEQYRVLLPSLESTGKLLSRRHQALHRKLSSPAPTPSLRTRGGY